MQPPTGIGGRLHVLAECEQKKRWLRVILLNCNRSYVLHSLHMPHSNTDFALIFFVRSGHIFLKTLDEDEYKGIFEIQQ